MPGIRCFLDENGPESLAQVASRQAWLSLPRATLLLVAKDLNIDIENKDNLCQILHAIISSV